MHFCTNPEDTIRELIKNKSGIQACKPSTAWVYGEKEFSKIVLRALTYKNHITTVGIEHKGCCLGFPDYECCNIGVKGCYATEFVEPAENVLIANGEVTERVVIRGGDKLLSLQKQAIEILLSSLSAEGIVLGQDVRVVLKGSKVTALSLGTLTGTDIGGGDFDLYNMISSLIHDNFGKGDMDLEILCCPYLPESRYNFVREQSCKIGAATVAYIHNELARTGMDYQLMQQCYLSSGEIVEAKKRRSFVIQRAFKNPLGVVVPVKGLVSIPLCPILLMLLWRFC
jgi:hypothetical protein